MSKEQPTYIYFKKSIIDNKKQNTLLNLLNNYVSARSGPQILSLKDEYTFRFSNFLMIGLCNFSANSWFGINSLPNDFLTK